MTAFIKSGHGPVSTTIVDQQIEQGKTFEEWWAAEDTNGLSEACKMSAWNAWLAATKQAELARPEVGEMFEQLAQMCDEIGSQDYPKKDSTHGERLAWCHGAVACADAIRDLVRSTMNSCKG